MQYRYIKVEKDRYKFILTLARPEKRNAFTPTMVNEIAHAIADANADAAIKIVLVKAEGPVFCAGMDLKVFEAPELDVINPEITNRNISLGEAFDHLEKPSIALVEGNVIAGGFLIVLGCSYVFCKREVQFRLPELAIGIFPFQVMASLLKIMPEKKVFQLCLETGYFDAQKAKELGIVDGFLEEESIETFITSFENINVQALQSGIQALRQLQTLSKEEQFSFLKECLDRLKGR